MLNNVGLRKTQQQGRIPRLNMIHTTRASDINNLWLVLTYVRSNDGPEPAAEALLPVLTTRRKSLKI